MQDALGEIGERYIIFSKTGHNDIYTIRKTGQNIINTTEKTGQMIYCIFGGINICIEKILWK